jgi:hypothetical protein
LTVDYHCIPAAAVAPQQQFNARCVAVRRFAQGQHRVISVAQALCCMRRCGDNLGNLASTQVMFAAHSIHPNYIPSVIFLVEQQLIEF